VQIYPALDLRGGRAARATAGAPADLLAAWRAAGARWAHIVDMDRAAGVGDNTPLVRGLLAEGGLHYQLGGALTGEAVTTALTWGARRVIVGGAGIGGLAGLIARHGADRVGFALDVRDAQAWSPSGAPLGDPATLCDRAVTAGARTIVYRDLARDGALSGADLAALPPWLRPDVDLVVAGGIAALDDLRALRGLGVAGVIVGRALVEGRLSIAEALECCG